MKLLAETDIWELFVPQVGQGDLYKFHLRSRVNSHHADKADPYAFAGQTQPRTASKVWDITGYEWSDEDWMTIRRLHNSQRAPISIYEVQLGSWMSASEENKRSLSYREIAPKLADYVETMGFTHVEMMPISEHAHDGSWGYRTIGYFAPVSRLGTPQDFMYLVDTLHRRGIGVILDWVPAHCPDDEQGLGFFDGTHLYEHPDPRQGRLAERAALIFNYGRREVKQFSHQQRSFLVRQIPCGWSEGGRCDGDALSRLRLRGGWLGAEPTRR